MGRLLFISIAFIFLFPVTGAAGPQNCSASLRVPEKSQDTIYNRQLLYNGRVWENRYQKILSHEFFMTRNPVSGSVTINGKTFQGILLRYDLFNDELLILDSPDTYLQLNKEAVSGFVLEIEGIHYIFENFDSLKQGTLKGYGQVLYHGTTWLVKKYIKEIKKNAVENIYDSFTESESPWLITGEEGWQLSSRKDLYRALSDKDAEVKSYIKSSGIRFRIKEPESVIPILKYYDSLKGKPGK